MAIVQTACSNWKESGCCSYWQNIKLFILCLWLFSARVKDWFNFAYISAMFIQEQVIKQTKNGADRCVKLLRFFATDRDSYWNKGNVVRWTGGKGEISFLKTKFRSLTSPSYWLKVYSSRTTYSEHDLLTN